MGYTIVIRGKPAGSNSGKGMVRGDQKIQAARIKNQGTDNCKNYINRKKSLCHFFDLR